MWKLYWISWLCKCHLVVSKIQCISPCQTDSKGTIYSYSCKNDKSTTIIHYSLSLSGVVLNKVNNFNLPKERKEIFKNLGKSNQCDYCRRMLLFFIFYFFLTCLHLETQISLLHPTDTFAMLQVSYTSYRGLWPNLYQ